VTLKVRPTLLACVGTAILFTAAASAQPPSGVTPEQVKAGAEIFAVNCSPCHGARMQDPQGAFDLKKFPRDQRERFANSIVRGKNQMPPWGDMLNADAIDALWAYVTAGER
jgi:mono/diheme cytochrome c family protein